MKTGTVKELFEFYGQRAPGFDALRLWLATIILIWHAFSICYTGDKPLYTAIAGYPLAKPVLKCLLPAFFFLGGFLVTGSAYRLKNVRAFLMFRVLRIVPALLVEVTLSAIILGAAMTTLPLKEYYTHPEFLSYFLNIIGYVHFYLPGVFSDNISQAVNINLWTLPPDFYSYLIMTGLMMAGIVYNRKKFTTAFILGTLGLAVFFMGTENWGSFLAPVVHQGLFMYAFFLGVLSYIFADKIPLRPSFFALSIVGLTFLHWDQTTIPGTLAACYATLCLGFIDFRNTPLVKRGDYSYGIYLYGFPIGQTLWHYVPAAREWWVLALMVIPATLAFAMLSWHFIEKPCLHLKRKFILKS